MFSFIFEFYFSTNKYFTAEETKEMIENKGFPKFSKSKTIILPPFENFISVESFDSFTVNFFVLTNFI